VAGSGAREGVVAADRYDSGKQRGCHQSLVFRVVRRSVRVARGGLRTVDRSDNEN
jgi:hypothetical protein